MRLSPALLLVPCLALPAAQTKHSAAPSAKAQIKQLTQERDDLKAKTDELQSQLSEAQQSRDQLKAQADAAQQELASMKSMLKENSGDADSLIRDLKAAREQLKDARTQLDAAQKENASLKDRYTGAPKEGDLVVESESVTPARALNLFNTTPQIKGWSRPKGIVVVNVLIDERGEVTAARLVQGLPGDDEKVKAANDACVEAAKKLVFDPARTQDGTKVKVWQGVGFNLD